MKVVLSVHQFLPEFHAGTEIITYGVARELLRHGHHVWVLSGFPGAMETPEAQRWDSYELDGIKVLRFKHATVPLAGQERMREMEYDSRIVNMRFEALLKEIKPDIAHFFHFWRLGSGIAELAERAGIPAWFTPTDFWAICTTIQLRLPDQSSCPGPGFYSGNCVRHVTMLAGGPKAALARWIPNFIFSGLAFLTAKGWLPAYPQSQEIADLAGRLELNVRRLNAMRGIFSPSRICTRLLQQHGVDPKKIIPLPWGMELGPFESQAKRQRGGQGIKTIGFAGTLSQHKGCHVLIDAFLRLPPGSARLKIYGNLSTFPDYVADLRRRAQGRDDIEFCGHFQDPEAAKIYSGLDALVVPSLWMENTPMVIYGAQAAGCPVLASDYEGMSQLVIHEKNGLLFPAGNVEALAALLKRVVSEGGLLERLSSQAIAPLSNQDHVKRLIQAYETALA